MGQNNSKQQNNSKDDDINSLIQKVLDIENLTNHHREVVSTTWAIKFNRPATPYKIILDKVKNKEKDIEDLPYFIVKTLNELGYNTPLNHL
ncbi:hypothetical protein V2595_06895 [Tenacibaculum maritimum]|uniref:hypothetical protein n=1 Tax=Tenacibaculum maritimum TaxID=107401 RepID=UPI003876BF95